MEQADGAHYTTSWDTTSLRPTGPGNLAGWHGFQALGLRYRLAAFQA